MDREGIIRRSGTRKNDIFLSISKISSGQAGKIPLYTVAPIDEEKGLNWTNKETKG